MNDVESLVFNTHTAFVLRTSWEARLCDRREVEEPASRPRRAEQGCLRRDCLAQQALAWQVSIASPPTGARGNPARRDGAKGHDNSAGAKEVMSVQYARVDGVLRDGAPPPVRRDARGQREQQRRAKPVVRTASDRRQTVLSFGQRQLRVLARPIDGESVLDMCFPPGI